MDGLFVMFFLIGTLSILSAVMGYGVYRKTEGGSKGWAYLSMGILLMGIMNFLLFMLSNFMFAWYGIYNADNIPKMIVDFLNNIILIYVLPFAAMRLVKDLGIERPSWFTERNMFLFNTVMWVMFTVTTAMIQPVPGIVELLFSSGNACMVFGSFFMAYSCFLIARKTTLKPWWVLMFASILIAGGTLAEQSVANTCGGWEFNSVIDGSLPEGSVGSPVCSEFMSDVNYMVVFPAGGLADPFFPLANHNDNIYSIAMIFAFLGLFLIWKSFR